MKKSVLSWSMKAKTIFEFVHNLNNLNHSFTYVFNTSFFLAIFIYFLIAFRFCLLSRFRLFFYNFFKLDFDWGFDFVGPRTYTIVCSSFFLKKFARNTLSSELMKSLPLFLLISALRIVFSDLKRA